LDRTGANNATIRLGSTQLETLTGAPMKGMQFSDLIDPSSRDMISRGFEKLRVKKTTQSFDIKSSFTDQRDTISGKVILCPLRDVFGRVTKAIVALQVMGRIKYPPYTFDIRRAAQDIDFATLSKIYKG